MTMVVSDVESVKSAQTAPKYKVGIFDFASCEGCELQIANLEEDILELLDTVEVVSFREVMKEHSDDYDIAFIEGSINRPVDEKRLKEIRANAKILIALGDCATTGCVNKLRNQWPDAENLKEVYADADIANNEYFDVFPTKKLNEVVDVDFYIRGCPVRKEQVLYYIRRLTTMAPRKNLDLRFGVTAREMEADTRSIIQYDPQKCILCRHCDIVCNEILDIHAIGLTNKGNESIISTPFNKGLDDNKCISCGQCLVNCPVGAFSEHSDVEKAIGLLDDPNNFVVFAIDLTAAAAAMEVLPTDRDDFGEALGSLIASLKSLGADRVVDFTHFNYLSLAAQGTYVSENDDMVFTSWCPSANSYIRKFHPEFKKNLQKVSSPEQMMLDVLGERYTKGEKTLKIILLSPCIVHKGNSKIDAVLTARELPRLLKQKGVDIDFHDPADGVFDCELGLSSVFVKGASSDYAYSLAIIQTAYMRKFNNLDARLAVTTLEDYVHEMAFDSEEGFFNALIIEDLAKASKYLTKDIAKRYNVVEFYPCFHGCLTGGGTIPTTSIDIIDQRRDYLRNFKGESKGPVWFSKQIIEAYDKQIKGGEF